MANTLNFFRGEYSKYLDLVNEGKIQETNLYFTIPDAEPNTADTKSSSYCVFHGTELLASATHEADLNKVIGDVSSLTERINNISSELAVYTISGITVDDANVKEAYQLVKTVGETKEQVGEVIKVYKDSSLKKVELTYGSGSLSTKTYITFTYILADGSETSVDLDVSEFLSQSEFKNGLVVSGNGQVSVKLGEETTTNKNFLDFEGNVDGEKALAVRSIDTDKTVLQKDIVVAGINGTLGTGNYKNGDTIAAGTDIYTILQNILSQEIYPTLTNNNYKTANITSSIAAPNVSLSQTGLKIYGTSITFSSSCNNTSVNTTPNQVSGLINGYSLTDDDKADSTATTITKNVTTGISDSTHSLVATFTGFTNQGRLETTGDTQTACKFENQAIGKISMGTNTVHISVTGPVVTGSAEAFSSGYTVSNLGNTDSTKTYSGKSAFSKTLSRPTNTKSASVTGVLPCYWNINGNILLSDTTQQCSLTSGKTFTNIALPSEVDNLQHFMFDFPADRTVSSFKVKDLTGAYVPFAATYSTDTEVTKTINGETLKYKRLQITGAFQGAGTYQIELSKNLNSADFTTLK